MKLSSRETARIFGALSDVTRVEIVRLVAKAPRNVTQLTTLVGVSQPKVSRHLRILRDAGLLRDVRRGKWVWYELVESSRDRAGSAAVSAISDLFSTADSRERQASLGAKISGEDTAPFAGSALSGTVSRREGSPRTVSPGTTPRGPAVPYDASLPGGVSGTGSSRAKGAPRPPSREAGQKKPGRKPAARSTTKKRAPGRATRQAGKALPTLAESVSPRTTKRKPRASRDEEDFAKKELEDFLL